MLTNRHHFPEVQAMCNRRMKRCVHVWYSVDSIYIVCSAKTVNKLRITGSCAQQTIKQTGCKQNGKYMQSSITFLYVFSCCWISNFEMTSIELKPWILSFTTGKLPNESFEWRGFPVESDSGFSFPICILHFIEWWEFSVEIYNKNEKFHGTLTEVV